MLLAAWVAGVALLNPVKSLAEDQLPSGVEGISLADPNLKAELLDTDPEEYFLSHDMDLAGRLYTGCREALYVYERTEVGGFQPRKELYRFPKDTWVYDLEAFGDDLLILTNTALYRLHQVGEENSQLEKILWGNPFGHYHQGLHGIDFAPDGDLLIVMGDPHPGFHIDKTRPDHLWMWTWYVGPENRPVPYAGVGAAMRLDLETYDFSVYASGLRNACGISFDRDWNLFANDNDQEGSTATPGRLVHVMEHSWNGWARGWDSTQSPARLDMIPNVNWAIDVPVGQGYYDHTTLGEAYRGSLFVANWGSRSVSHHPVKPRGAGFRAKSLPFLQGDGIRRPVSAMPTNDGRLIVALCYMKSNAPSPVCQTDLLLISPRESKNHSAFDHSERPLIELLSEPIQLRAKAHREILRQGGEALEEAATAFSDIAPADPAFSSLIFLAAAHGDAASIERITSLLSQSKGRVASLAWRAAAAWPEKFSALTETDITTAAAKLDDPKLLAGLLKFLHAAKRPIPDSVATLAAHDDPFVRQSAAILLARHAESEQLNTLAEGTEIEQRAATLATVFRLWQSAESIQELPEGSQIASDKQMSLRHPDGAIDLHEFGAPVGIYRLADWWQNADVRSAHQTEFDRLKKALSSADKDVANAAATGLFFLNDERVDRKVASVLGKSEITLSIVAGKASKEDLKKALLALEGAKISTDAEVPEAFRGIDWDGENAPSGDSVRGKALFVERGCVACHLSPHDGAGGSIGPTLVAVGERFPPSYLAASILLPNLAVSPNFHPNTVTMKDGTIHTGFSRPGEAPGLISLQLITGQAIELNQKDIASQDASELSLMPAGLVQTPEEMAHLIAYMRAIHPKPDPKKKAAPKKAAPKQPSPATPRPIVLKAALSDWETTGNWKVDDDGTFVLTPRPGEVDWKRYGDYLWSKQPYQNFEITFEYKHEEGGNSGFYFNVTDRQQAVGSVIEVQIRDSSKVKELNAHAVTGGVLPGITPKANAAKPAGEWNRMRVKSENGIVAVFLNGVLANHVRLTHPKLKAKPKEGYFGFQDHGLPFWLRNIRVRDLSASSAKKAPPRNASVANPQPKPSGASQTAEGSPEGEAGALSQTNNQKLRTAAQRPPNVVLILSDDMGYSDLPKFGKSEIPTPNIDRLADEGTLFTNAYVTAPVCVVSRMGLLSGQNQQRFGIYDNLYGEERVRKFLDQTLLPTVFQKAGYATGFVGKWHLNGNKKEQYSNGSPLQRGFDESVGIQGGDSPFWEGTPVYRGSDPESFPAPEYLTDYWGTEACAFIDRNTRSTGSGQEESQPFFLYLAYNAVHSPMHALDEDQETFADVEDENRRIYDGMLLSMDRSIGRVLDRLDHHGIADNTIVVFLNDNGGGGSTGLYADHSRNYANNLPLRGHKFDVLEGGVRVPMILRWPREGGVPADQVYEEMVSSTDVYPTLVEAAGLQMPKGQPTDGVDLLPFLNGKTSASPHEWLCWQNRAWQQRNGKGTVVPTMKVHNSAIRKGDWKLVRLDEKIGSDTEPPAWQLYNLKRDIGEQNDVANRHEERVQELSALFDTWRASMHPTVE